MSWMVYESDGKTYRANQIAVGAAITTGVDSRAREAEAGTATSPPRLISRSEPTTRAMSADVHADDGGSDD